MKIISLHKEKQTVALKVEGISGKTYSLDTLHPEFIDKIKGASLESGQLRFTIPEGTPGEFITHTIVIELKKQ
jgi:hypothetical protein